MMYAGSFAEPFGTVPVVFGVLPLISAIAAAAAAFASFRVSFQTVIVCQPLMMFLKPCRVASCPVPGIGRVAVERDVDRRDAALGLPVVVDRRDALRLGCLFDRRS